MADISQIKTLDGTTYDIKDTTARTNAAKVNVTLNQTTKGYLLGTTATPTATAALTESIADTGVYLSTTTGQLVATTFSVNQAVNLVYNSTTSALEFVFT